MRKNGVMLPISSIPAPFGIGTMGWEARNFVDQLQRNGQSIWQILPINPTSYGDSPYAAVSTFAGNPYLIDLPQLAYDGLLNWHEFEHEQWYTYPDRVDYAILSKKRRPLLKTAAWRLLQNKPYDYDQFLKDNESWLDDYALFMAIKESQGGKAWKDWPEEYKVYTPEKAAEWKKWFKNEIEITQAIQYLFFRQWKNLKNYANEHGVEILGDIPIYVSMDSVDAWSHPELFLMDEHSNPSLIAAVPPDAFSAQGQLWGNPVYDWEAQKKDGYSWWIERLRRMSEMYDIMRIDHFRGFDSFYAVTPDAPNAMHGKWYPGPGADLFEKMREQIGEQNIIAEDLGIRTPSVDKLLKDLGYPGMKVLEFGLFANTTEGQENLPFAYPVNSVAYAGTHDNNTIVGWFDSLSREDKEYVREYVDSWEPNKLNWKIISTLLASPSDTSIVMVQDLLGLGADSRMNKPGELGSWQWRLMPGQLDENSMRHLRYLTRVYRRLPEQRIAPDQNMVEDVVIEEVPVEEIPETEQAAPKKQAVPIRTPKPRKNWKKYSRSRN